MHAVPPAGVQGGGPVATLGPAGEGGGLRGHGGRGLLDDFEAARRAAGQAVGALAGGRPARGGEACFGCGAYGGAEACRGEGGDEACCTGAGVEVGGGEACRGEVGGTAEGEVGAKAGPKAGSAAEGEAGAKAGDADGRGGSQRGGLGQLHAHASGGGPERWVAGGRHEGGEGELPAAASGSQDLHHRATASLLAPSCTPRPLAAVRPTLPIHAVRAVDKVNAVLAVNAIYAVLAILEVLAVLAVLAAITPIAVLAAITPIAVNATHPVYPTITTTRTAITTIAVTPPHRRARRARSVRRGGGGEVSVPTGRPDRQGDEPAALLDRPCELLVGSRLTHHA